MNKLSSRKFGFAVAGFVMACIFLYIDKIGGGEWVTITTLILGMYKAANVLEHKNDS